MKNLRIIVTNTVVGGCYIDKGHYCDSNHANSAITVTPSNNGGYTYTSCYYTQSSHTETRYRPCDGHDDGTGHCSDCGKPKGGTGPSGRWCDGSYPYQATVTDTTYHHSSTHKYECAYTNGQLIGIVINYTVGDTTGTATLTY